MNGSATELQQARLHTWNIAGAVDREELHQILILTLNKRLI